MKKLIFLFITAIIFSSCSVDVIDTVEDSKKETTVELQELEKDTVIISIVDNNLYVFNKDKEVIYKTIGTKFTDYWLINSTVFIIIITCISTLIIILGAIIKFQKESIYKSKHK
jgi:PBP1b-binding outer membrane lipoprotein LpoB